MRLGGGREDKDRLPTVGYEPLFVLYSTVQYIY
jgi:hypothetical protein